MTITEESVDLSTPTGTMRTHLYRPTGPGRHPGLVLFSEIFQRTGPIGRTAGWLAGHGYVVAVPDIFHEFEPAGCAIAYDGEGTERGNRHKVGKPVTAYDADASAALACLGSLASCTGKLGVIGICIGGHLAFRAARNPEVRAAACFYATDIHKGSLGLGGDATLAQMGDIGGELLMIWGRQDPHVPLAGRALIHQKMTEHALNFTWHEFNGAHAFLRDEGHRYDPELAAVCLRLVLDLFHRRLGEGAVLPGKSSETVGAGETRC